MNNKKLVGGILSYGVDTLQEVHYKLDSPVSYYVANYTHNYFSVGATTSGFGFVGVWLSTAHKRGGSGGQSHTQINGFLLQVGVLLCKLYLYVYFDGSGLNRKVTK